MRKDAGFVPERRRHVQAAPFSLRSAKSIVTTFAARSSPIAPNPGRQFALALRTRAVWIATTNANAAVAPTHPQAMPVILTNPAEVDQRLEAETPIALKLQRPLPDEALSIVAKGEKEDGPPALAG